MKLLLVGLIGIALGGCMSVGRAIDPAAVAALKVGTTTQTQAIQSLGTPTETIASGDGSTILEWVHLTGRVSGSSFIPIAGAFVGSATSTNDSLILTFDQGGVLRKIQTTHGSATGHPL